MEQFCLFRFNRMKKNCGKKIIKMSEILSKILISIVIIFFVLYIHLHGNIQDLVSIIRFFLFKWPRTKTTSTRSIARIKNVLQRYILFLFFSRKIE